MKKKRWIVFVMIGLCVVGGLFYGVDYLYNYAVVRGDKSFISSSEASGSTGDAFRKWQLEADGPETRQLTSRDGLKLHGTLFKHKETKEIPKLAIIAHGYASKASFMKSYAQLFDELGYDVFLPDARGHGASEGDYIGFGWHDRLDYVDWITLMNNEYHGAVSMVLYGVSMGAATVMMTAGEKLPTNVKAVIEDCGYDTVENELAYQLKEMFHLPRFPLLSMASMYTDMKVDYNFKEASAVNQLKKNSLPVLFIHGDADDFVPTDMVHTVYEATKGPKEKYIVKDAGHAQAYKTDPVTYKKVVATFLATYMK